MIQPPPGACAVIFLSGRNDSDPPGYAEAAAAMAAAASRCDGYLGIDSVRDAAGVGITVSWWRDEAAALAWRADPDHARIRDQGRARWYDWYRVIVADVTRGYDWVRESSRDSPGTDGGSGSRLSSG